MKPHAKKSKRDWVLLSAYLDGDLSGRKKDNLLRRLKHEPGLQAALENLEHVKKVLGSLPKKKAPRDFRISPEMVEKPIIPSFVRMLQIALAGAAVGLMVLLSLEFFNVLPLHQTALVDRDMLEKETAAVQPEMQTAPFEEPIFPIIEWHTPDRYAGLGAGIGGGGGDGSASSQLPPWVVLLPDAELSLSELATVGDPVEKELAQTSSEQMEGSVEESMRDGTDSGPILGIRPSEEQGKIFGAQPKESAHIAAEPELKPASVLENLRWIEIALLAMLLLTGIPALILTKKSRKIQGD